MSFAAPSRAVPFDRPGTRSSAGTLVVAAAGNFGRTRRALGGDSSPPMECCLPGGRRCSPSARPGRLRAAPADYSRQRRALGRRRRAGKLDRDARADPEQAPTSPCRAVRTGERPRATRPVLRRFGTGRRRAPRTRRRWSARRRRSCSASSGASARTGRPAPRGDGAPTRKRPGHQAGAGMLDVAAARERVRSGRGPPGRLRGAERAAGAAGSAAALRGSGGRGGRLVGRSAGLYSIAVTRGDYLTVRTDGAVRAGARVEGVVEAAVSRPLGATFACRSGWSGTVTVELRATENARGPYRVRVTRLTRRLTR